MAARIRAELETPLQACERVSQARTLAGVREALGSRFDALWEAAGRLEPTALAT